MKKASAAASNEVISLALTNLVGSGIHWNGFEMTEIDELAMLPFAFRMDIGTTVGTRKTLANSVVSFSFYLIDSRMWTLPFSDVQHVLFQMQGGGGEMPSLSLTRWTSYKTQAMC